MLGRRGWETALTLRHLCHQDRVRRRKVNTKSRRSR